METRLIIHHVPIKGYHAYKVKLPVGAGLTFMKDTTVPSYKKILAQERGRTVGSIGVPLNAIFYDLWTELTVDGIIDGQPRFGGSHRYRRATGRAAASAGGGAYHTATLTVEGSAPVISRVEAVAREMNLL